MHFINLDDIVIYTRVDDEDIRTVTLTEVLDNPSIEKLIWGMLREEGTLQNLDELYERETLVLGIEISNRGE